MKRTLALVVASISAILLFLLASASSNTTKMFGQYYLELLGLNILLATGLAATLAVKLYKLFRKVKQRVFGSRITLRMTMMFALVAAVPGLLMYILSVQFLTRSIDTWFDVRVDTALERGLNLGHSAIDYSLQDLERRGRIISQVINENGSNDIDLFSKLAILREQFNIQKMTLFSLDGKVLANLSGDSDKAAPLPPNPDQLRQAEYRSFSTLDTDSAQHLIMRVIVPIHINAVGQTGKVLQLIQPVPERLAADAEVLDQVRNDYKQLSLSRSGLKGIYSLTLTVAFLMLMLGAFVLGIYLSDKLSAPLNLLAAGTRAVTQGDYSQQQPVVSRDELGILTHSFNRMTRQLAEARVSLELHQAEQAAAKAYLETILTNMVAGVLSFDENWYLRSHNESAIHILHYDLTTLNHVPLPEWKNHVPEFIPLCTVLAQGFTDEDIQHWQHEVELPLPSDNRVLFVHCARVQKQHAEDTNSGYVIVLDDITHLIAAQRDAAWGEVARRLAHEIKNPLTPIQLAAERLEHKLGNKLSENDSVFLQRGTQTIVNQVAALKNMVDAFKEYARQPSGKKQVIDFAAILNEVLILYENMPLSVQIDVPTPILISGDATLLRQLIHNLLQNAQDAVSGQKSPRVNVHLEKHKQFITLTVKDNGDGFPASILSRIFEPYSTTKVKGTGLGLAIVKKIVEEHQGRIQAGNQEQGGAFVRIDLPCWEEMCE